MNYQKIYNDLIAKRQVLTLTKDKTLNDYQYCESHHIVPRCLGGLDDKTNIVNLTAREHFIAHILLMKIYPSNIKLACAIKMMMIFSKYNPRNIKSSSKKYYYIKSIISKIQSQKQSQLRWIKNDNIHKTTFWPKTLPLTQEMINDGWKFGRLKFTIIHKHTKYIGYGKNKYIHITNDNEIDQMMWPKNDPLPIGWHKGISIYSKQKISKSRIGISGTTTGKRVAYNTLTNEVRFFNKEQQLPDNWKYGTIHKKKHRIFSYEEDQYIMTHYIKESMAFCNVSRNIISRRIQQLKNIYPDFIPLKAPNNKPGLIKKSKETCKKLSQALKNKPKSESHKKAIGKNSSNRVHYTNGKQNIFIKNDQPIPDGFYKGVTFHKAH